MPSPVRSDDFDFFEDLFVLRDDSMTLVPYSGPLLLGKSSVSFYSSYSFVLCLS